MHAHVSDATARLRTLPPSALNAAAGTNPRDDLCRSDWRFLLPKLRYESLLYLGSPTAPVVNVLSGMARRVVIVARDSRAPVRLGRETRESRPRHVHFVRADPFRRLPFADRAFDLIVAHDVEARRLLRAAGGVSELDRLLDRDGCIQLETDRLVDALRIHKRLPQVRALDFAAPRVLWLTRRKGTLRLALAHDDYEAARYCLDHVVAGISRMGRTLRRVARVLARLRVLPYVIPRRILLLTRPTESPGDDGPRPYWLPPDGDARVSGVGRAALYARADHNANKVIVLRFGRSKRPEVVVKIPRAPEYNVRLEHEHYALVQLHERGVARAGTYPEALYLRYHAGLAIHGQTMLHGAAFRNRTLCHAACPHAADAIEWITHLGEASVDRARVNDLPDRLTDTFARFLRIYRIADAEADFLADRIAALERAGDGVSRVFQHGDPGTWNIVVGDDGRSAFLDWEDADPQGLPLWDLFNFFHSLATWIGRVNGRKDDAATYAQSYFEPTDLSRLQTEATARYCERVGVDRGLLEPLFYTCWLNRAVRSAASIVGEPETGAYFRQLRLAIQHRNSRGLTCMFE